MMGRLRSVPRFLPLLPVPKEKQCLGRHHLETEPRRKVGSEHLFLHLG